MNGQTITAQDFLSELTVIEKALANLKAKVLVSLLPKYGSDVWWKKMDEEGLKQIKRGDVVKFENTKQLSKHLGL